MAPHTSILPQAQTDSAREVRRAFYCELCSKQYARINELEAHENSYDHQHRKRLKDMKAMTRMGATSAAKQQKAERRKMERGSEMVSLKVGAAGREGREERPIGFFGRSTEKSSAEGDAAGVTARSAGEVGGEDKGEEEDRWEERPIAWDELDSLGELIDLTANRPPAMQRLVGTRNEYMALRGKDDLYNDIWTKVEGLRNTTA